MKTICIKCCYIYTKTIRLRQTLSPWVSLSVSGDSRHNCRHWICEMSYHAKTCSTEIFVYVMPELRAVNTGFVTAFSVLYHDGRVNKCVQEYAKQWDMLPRLEFILGLDDTWNTGSAIVIAQCRGFHSTAFWRSWSKNWLVSWSSLCVIVRYLTLRLLS